MSVRIVKAWRPTGSKVLMYADLSFFGSLEVRGWRLLNSKDGGYFVGYPNSPVGDGKRIRQAIPTTQVLQDQVKEVLIRTYTGLGGCNG
jgi:DNA-binding cell septation regulator SpoVG